MKFKLSTIAAASLLAVCSAQAADVSTTLSGVSDYRFRGVSQNAGDPTVQASIDIAFDSGIYAGIWGSQVDFEDDADIEADYYIGYYGELDNGIGYEAMLTYYTYPGYDYDSDYAELTLKAYYENFTFEYDYADDYANSDESGHYIAVNYSKVLAEQVSIFSDVAVNVHAGRSFGDVWSDDADYIDTSVGISGSAYGLDIALDYLYNDVESEYEVDDGAFRNDNTLLLTVSSTFDLASF